MLTLLRQAKIRKHRLENLLLLETLVFFCIPSGRVKDIMRLLRLGASPAGSLQGLSDKISRRLEATILSATPGLLSVGISQDGPALDMHLSWPEIEADLRVVNQDGELRADLEISGQGREVGEIARDARQL